MDIATDPWGVKVERVEMYVKNVCMCSYVLLYNCSKDVRLPANLQRAMAAEAEATRESKAKVCSVIIGVLLTIV